MKDLGTYLCLAENSERVYLSQPVTIMLPRESPTLTPDPWSVASFPDSTEPSVSSSL